MYRHRDIWAVVSEARLRGIQVLLEVDTPGHSEALGKVFPSKFVCSSHSSRHN